MPAKAVLFDYGNVLVRWDPENLYKKLIPDAEARKRFLTDVCPLSWHAPHDGGAMMADTLPARAMLFPAHADLIHAWGARYGEMIDGEIEGSLTILDDLAAAGVPLAMLTNMPADQQEACFRPFSRKHLFKHVIVSGPLMMMKPDARIYRHTLDIMGFAAKDVLFIDDSARNIVGAAALGMRTHRFTSPESLRAALAADGVLR
ncbi:MAG: HAD family phosphatase [Caulobacterales bacterium]